MTLSYPEKYLPEEEWERAFRMKRELDAALADHEWRQMMQREPSPALRPEGNNRAERRRMAAQNRRRNQP